MATAEMAAFHPFRILLWPSLGSRSRPCFKPLDRQAVPGKSPGQLGERIIMLRKVVWATLVVGVLDIIAAFDVFCRARKSRSDVPHFFVFEPSISRGVDETGRR